MSLGANAASNRGRAAVGWFLLEAQGSCFSVNHTLLAWLGLQRAGDFLGLGWTFRIPPESQSLVHFAIDQLQGGHGSTTARLDLRPRRGGRFTVLATFVQWDAIGDGYPHGILVSLERGDAQACLTEPSRSASAS